MAWSCMAAGEISTLAFAEDFVAARRNMMNLQAHCVCSDSLFSRIVA